MSARSEHENSRLPSSGTSAGVLLATASVFEMLAMAHHPSLGTHDIAQAIQQIDRLAYRSAVVHGVLIALMLIITYGFSEFVFRSGPRRPLLRAGCVAYFAGVMVMIGATLMSGWVVGGLTALTPHTTELDRQITAQLLTLCDVVNRSCANVAVVAMSAGIGCWSLQLLGHAGIRRLVGAFGCVVSALPPAALISGTLSLDVHGMSVVVVLQAVWNIAVGMLLIRARI